MAVKLGARPKSFPSTVKFPLLEGQDGTIKVDFKYRTLTEYAKFVDQMVEDAKKAGRDYMKSIRQAAEAAVKAAAEKAATGEPETEADDEAFANIGGNQSELVLQQRDAQVRYIMQVVQDWDVINEDGAKEGFTKEAVEQLCDELPAAAKALIEAYRVACTEGRLGN